MKKEFKVGDSVRCIGGDFYYITIGKVYVIIQLGSDNTIYIRDNDNDEASYGPEYFELVDEYSTNLLEKLNIAKSYIGKSVTYLSGGNSLTIQKVELVTLESELKNYSTHIESQFRKDGYAVVMIGNGGSIAFENIVKIVEKSSKLVLNKEYTAIVYKDRVEVGCQTFPISVVENILKLSELIN